MAKSDIVLDIGTRFNGEGFTKLNQSIKGAAGKTRQASQSINQVVQALGGVEGRVGKIFNSINGLMGGFAQGGAFGLAFAGIGAAFTLVMNKIKEAKEKAKQAAEEMRDSFKKMFDGLGDKIQEIRGDGNKRIEQSTYSTERLGKQISRETKDDIAKIRSEGIDRRSGMIDEEEKAVDLAKEELEIQKLITKSVKEQNDLKVKNASDTYNAKVGAQEKSINEFNAAIDSYNKNIAEIDKKIAEEQNKLAEAKQFNAGDHPFRVSANGGAITISQELKDTKQFEDRIKELTEQRNKLDDIKQEAIKKIDIEKSQLDVQHALDSLVDATKERESSMIEASLAEKKAEDKLNQAVEKRIRSQQDAANAFTKGYQEQQAADKAKADAEAARKKDKEIQDKINAAKEAGAKVQKDLNKQLDDAKKAVKDWIENLDKRKGQSFGDFNKEMNKAAKDNAVQIGVDADGNPISIDKKQENQVKSNKQNLDRLLKIKNPNAQVKAEIERRQAFDDMFNPEKLKERQKAAEELEKKKLAAEQKMQEDIHNLKLMLVDNKGVAI